MAGTKLTGLAELVTLIDTDIIYAVDDPGGTPISKKSTILNFWDNYLLGKVTALNPVTSTNAITADTIVVGDDGVRGVKVGANTIAEVLARANHTGTQLAATISDFDTAVTALLAADHGNLTGLADDDHVQYLLADGTRPLAIGSDADGDLWYRSSSAIARLAKGTADQVLTMNAGATAPEWSASGGGGDFIADLVNSETSVTGAVTASAFGTQYNVSGSSAYTITLTAVSGNGGKFMSFRFDSLDADVWVTLDANSTEKIIAGNAGAETRVYVKGEMCVLFCTGTAWIVATETLAPVFARAELASDQSINTNSQTLMALATIVDNVGGKWDTTNYQLGGTGYELPPGIYQVIVQSRFNNLTTAKTCGLNVNRNGSIETYGPAVGNVRAGNANVLTQTSAYVKVTAATDYISADAFHLATGSIDLDDVFTSIQIVRLTRETA